MADQAVCKSGERDVIHLDSDASGGWGGGLKGDVMVGAPSKYLSV